jgi:hypothetical protein
VLPTAPGQAPLDPELAALAAATPSAVDWRGAYGLDPGGGGGPRAVVGPVKDQVRCHSILHLRHRKKKKKDTRLLAARKENIFLRPVSFSNSKNASRVNGSQTNSAFSSRCLPMYYIRARAGLAGRSAPRARRRPTPPSRSSASASRARTRC